VARGEAVTKEEKFCPMIHRNGFLCRKDCQWYIRGKCAIRIIAEKLIIGRGK